MSNQIEVEVKAKDTSAEAMWERNFRALDTIVDRLKKVEKASDDATKKTVSGLENIVQSGVSVVATLTGISGGLGLVQMGIGHVNREWDAYIARQEKARQSAVKGADPVRTARLSFVADETMQSSQLESEFRNLSAKTGMDQDSVARIAGEAFSAGAASNRDALNAVEAAAALTPHDEASANTMTVRAIHMSNLKGGVQDPKANMGFMLQAAKATTVKDAEKLGAALVPAIQSTMGFGDTAEQAGELFAVINNLTQDVMGRESSTGQTNLAKSLGTFVTTTRGKDKDGGFRIPQEQIDAFKAAKSTTERIAVMQQSPELRRQFMGNTSFEAGMFDPARRILSGDESAMIQFQRARETITALDASQAANYEKKLAELNAGSFNPAREADLLGASELETFRRTDTVGQRTATSRKILEDTLETAGETWVSRKLAGINFEIDKGQEPEKAARTVLSSTRRDYEEQGGDPRVIALLERQIALLDRQIRALDENTRATQDNSKTATGTSPGAPPRPVPSSGRSQ